MRLWLMLCLLASGLCCAEQSKNFGDYTIHYQAVPTDMLPPAVAQAQGFSRAKNQYLLNVTVLKNDAGTGVALAAEIRVEARDLVGAKTEIVLRKVQEKDSVYYIGTFRVTHEDLWRFKLSAIPEGSSQALEINWEQRFDTL